MEERHIMHLFGLCMSGIFLSDRESLKKILEEDMFWEEIQLYDTSKNYDHVISKL